jgi:hypothetical protein
MSESAQNQAGDIRTLAHDLKTPLTSLKSCLDLVRAGDAGPVTPEQDRFLKIALRNLSHLDELIEALGAGCRESGSEPARSRDLDLGPILAEAVSLHAAAAERAGQKIDATGLPSSFFTCTEPGGVVRMLDNILGNAVRHAGAGARIRVWLDTRTRPAKGLALQLARHFFLPDHFFSLVVEDSGTGLPERILRRAEGGPSKAGMGLQITTDLARIRGGELRLVSGPGQGTTAWIRLPMDPDTAHLQRAAGELERALGVPGASLVLLDLREGPGAAALHAERVESFLTEEQASCPGGGIELAHGLWAAVVDDPATWQARWDGFAATGRPGLETMAWEPFPWEPTGNDAKSEETFNPSAEEPITSR